MTRTDLIKRVLQKLRELEFDESPSSSETSLIGDKYDEVYAELNKNGLISWSPAGDIPSTHAPSVIKVTAAESADDFFVEEPRYSRLQVEAYGPRLDGTGGAMARLKQMEHIHYVSTDEPVHY